MRTRITLAFLLSALVTASAAGQEEGKQNASGTLVSEFKNEKGFWKQVEIAKKIVALKDAHVLNDLVDWLNHDDRHIRGKTAVIFAGRCDDRGFPVITARLDDRSDRPEGQGQSFAS